MADSTILTPAEIVQITGKKQFKAQQRALKKMEIRFIARPDGSVVVSRALATTLLGLLDTAPATAPRATPKIRDFGLISEPLSRRKRG